MIRSSRSFSVGASEPSSSFDCRSSCSCYGLLTKVHVGEAGVPLRDTQTGNTDPDFKRNLAIEVIEFREEARRRFDGNSVKDGRPVFCVLTGLTLRSYASELSASSGCLPTNELFIRSATDPSPTNPDLFTIISYTGTRVQCRAAKGRGGMWREAIYNGTCARIAQGTVSEKSEKNSVTFFFSHHIFFLCFIRACIASSIRSLSHRTRSANTRIGHNF